MIEYIADTVFKSWKTTIVALLVFGLITYLGVSKGMAWDQLYGWYAAAFALLFVADPKVIKQAKQAQGDA